MIRRPPRSTQSRSSASSDVYKRQLSRLVRGPLNLGEVDSLFDHLVERRQFAELQDHVDELVGDVVHLRLGVEAAKAEADGAVRDVVAEAESLEDVAGLQGGRGAGRAGADGDIVDAHQQGLAFDVDEAHVEIAGKVVIHVAVDVDVVQRLLELGAEAVSYTHLTLPTIYSV